MVVCTVTAATLARLLKPCADSIESLVWVGYDFEKMAKQYCTLLRNVARHTRRVTSRVVEAALADGAVDMTLDQRLQFGDWLPRALSHRLGCNSDKGTGVRMSTPVRSVLASLSISPGLKKSTTSLNDTSKGLKRSPTLVSDACKSKLHRAEPKDDVETNSCTSVEQEAPAD